MVVFQTKVNGTQIVRLACHSHNCQHFIDSCASCCGTTVVLYINLISSSHRFT